MFILYILYIYIRICYWTFYLCNVYKHTGQFENFKSLSLSISSQCSESEGGGSDVNTYAHSAIIEAHAAGKTGLESPSATTITSSTNRSSVEKATSVVAATTITSSPVRMNRSSKDFIVTTPVRDVSQISMNRKLSMEATTMNESYYSSSPKPAFISYSTGPLRRAIAGLVMNTTQRYIHLQDITTVLIGKGYIYS